MSEELQFHPYANLFPLIEGAEFDALVEDIKANGLRNRIVIFDGKILDGRNRYRAAKAAGIKLCGICNEDGKPVAPSWSTHFIDLVYAAESDGRKQTQDDALRFVLSENLHRRHLTDRQRAAVAADIANLGHGGDRSKSPIGDLNGVGQADAAKMLNTSKRAVERAAKRKKEDPAAHEAAKSGKVERKSRTPKPATPELAQKEFAQGVVDRAGDFMLQLLEDMKSVSPEFMDQVTFKVQGLLGKFEDIYCDGGQDDEDDQDPEPQCTNPKEPAVNADEPAEPASTPQESVSPKGTICSDPERLKKLEQWRRQHSKQLYGAATAGGAK